MATDRKEQFARMWHSLKEKLVREIKPDDLLKMKTSSTVKRVLSDRDLSSIRSTLTLLEELEYKGAVAPRQTDSLIDILEDIGRTDLALEVLEYRGKHHHHDQIDIMTTGFGRWIPRLNQKHFFDGLLEASLSHETCKTLYRGRVMLVGAYGAGKTSTKRSLFNEPYETKHLYTDGADVYSIDITEWIIKECATDYSSHKSVKPMQKLLGDVLVSGMDKAKFRIAKQQTTKADVANVLDAVKLEGERISDVFTRLEPYNRLLRMRRSEKSDVYFNLWDFAGQSVYYITHQVFLSSRVIYILVTDLTKSLDDTLPLDDGECWKIKQYLTFWMNSIHTHASQGSIISRKQLDGSDKMAAAPPVIILGTKKDLLLKRKWWQTLKSSTEAAAAIDGEAEKRLLEIKGYLCKHATRAVNAHVVDMIAIDNKSRTTDSTIADPAVETLRAMLQKLAKEYFFLGKVPAKWLRLEISLKELHKEKTSLDEVKELGNELKMEEAEIMKALEFYHDVGEILHFRLVPELKNTVILNVNWLLNLFKIVINKSFKHTKDLGAPAKLSGLIDELHGEGRLHEEFVDYLLKRQNREEDKTILIKMMEMYDIICEMPRNPKQKRLYYLPCLLQKDAEGGNNIIFPANSSVHCQLHFHFVGNFLPEGLFYRLLVRCLKRWPESVAVLRRHKALMYFPKNEFYITMCKEDADIQLKILNIPAGDQHSPPPQSMHVSNVRQQIEEELCVVIKTYNPSLVYHAAFKCQCPNHRVGELLPGSEDIDDRCVPLSNDKSSGVCPRSAMVMKDRKSDMWYWTEGKHTETYQQEVSAQGFKREGIYTLNQLFCTLDEKLTQADKRSMVNLLLHKQISKRDAEKLETPYHVFGHLKEQGDITKDNMELLKKVFQIMKRPKLVKDIDEYLQGNKACYSVSSSQKITKRKTLATFIEQ